jgi:hypothetical protein
MRVVVVGMLSRQEQLVPVNEYRNLKISFANGGRRYGLSSQDAFREADRIIVMTKFVSHSLTDMLDKRKTTLIRGGFGKLKDTLDNLNKTAAVQSIAAVEAANESVLEETEEMASEKINFSAFKTAKPGDVLIFKRPPHTTLAKFEIALQIARSYYKRNHGVLSEIPEFKDGRAEVLVTEVKGKAINKPVLTKQEQAEDASVKTATEKEPGPIDSRFVELERAFWQEVYLTAMRHNPAGLAHHHAEVANDAVDALRKKIPA